MNLYYKFILYKMSVTEEAVLAGIIIGSICFTCCFCVAMSVIIRRPIFVQNMEMV